jgi:hypothetical protein
MDSAERITPMSEQVRRKLKAAMQENASLKAEVERLTNNCNYLDQKLDDELDKSAMLCGQVERLTKAGDAMAVHLAGCYRSEGYDPQKCREIDIWNAAKEGKPSA